MGSREATTHQKAFRCEHIDRLKQHSWPSYARKAEVVATLSFESSRFVGKVVPKTGANSPVSKSVKTVRADLYARSPPHDQQTLAGRDPILPADA
jgi:hypothetical protein